ncbi:MAG TPA: hypothetical protein EYO86_03370, partial [Pelagibacterales bacterium]|nr:hypothetical protein [Pelagibacterales bacterium]
MKRENLIARKKVKNNKHLFKDSKILNFYKKFKSIIFKDIKDKTGSLNLKIVHVYRWDPEKNDNPFSPPLAA